MMSWTLNQFFSGTGPLATFNAKIEMAYLLKIATKECRRVMHVIRRIRNEFAHSVEPIAFDDPKIKDMCSHLIQIDDARQFMTDQLAIELHPDGIPELLEMVGPKMIGKNCSAREMYIDTVQIISFCFAVGIS